MRELKQRVAVVTGAASGIGRALAVELAEAGCVLSLSDIDDHGLQGTRSLVEKSGVRITTRHLDVADRKAVHDYADQVAAEHGRVNLIFNNAGVALTASIEEMSYDDFEWLMNINFWGVVYGTKAFLPHLKRAGEGHIVNVSSVFGLIGIPTQSAYNAAKFAVRGFTECLREELEIERCGVSATCVYPGGIRTDIVRNSRIGQSVDPPDREQLVEEFDGLARTSPERAARTILKGVRSDARRVLIGPDAYLIDQVQRWLPTAYQGLLARLARRREGAS